MTEQITSAVAAENQKDEISLIDLAITFGEEKKTILRIAGGATALAVVVSLLMTPIFTAKTVMLPPQQQSGAASALASLGALTGLAAGATGLKSQDDMYVAFLQSDSLKNALIEKLELKERYQAKTMQDARLALKNNVKVTSDKKSGLISIEADDVEPKFAAKLANAHVEELRNLLDNLAVTDAQQRRVFYEEQIRKIQEELANAEALFRSAKAESGMLVTAVMAETGVRASAELYAQIASKEVQLQAMGRFATQQNPELQRVAGDLSALRAQLVKMERGTGGAEKASSTQQSAVKAYRDIKAHEAMLGVMIAQYESASVDEAKEGPLIQQVDVATVPELKSRPQRALIVVVSALAGLFFGVLYAFARRTAGEPRMKKQIQRLKAVWRWTS